jgi:Ca-activated chloride channel family protein
MRGWKKLSRSSGSEHPGAELQGSCLRTAAGAPIPLRSVELSGEVVSSIATIRVRQTYRNTESKPVEAIYTFPLPSDSTLAAFSMQCAGRRLQAEVREREQAFRDYDEAMSQGHGAALLEQERANVFSVSVGNLLPDEETVVEVEYVQRAQAEDGALRLCIPTLVAPRYIPGSPKGDRTAHGTAEPTERVPDADRISPPAGNPDYGVSLDLTVDLGGPVVVESPSHALSITAAGEHRMRIQLSQDEAPLDRDIVLLVQAQQRGAQLTTVTAHRDASGKGVFCVTVVPELQEPAAPPGRHEVVFVFDRSGSMGGASLEQARQALRLCLRHLREGDRFNIIAFDTACALLAPAPLPFTQSTLAQADRWIASIQARGGTELLEPMVQAVRMAGEGGIVMLLTDGQVGNEREIAERVISMKSGATIYSFGIGTNISDMLLRELSRETGGAAEFIHPGERIDEKVIAQFSRATAARVSEVAVRFEGLEVGELTPAEPGPVVDGEPWTLFGSYERAGSGAVVIRGKLRGSPYRLEFPIRLPSKADRPAILKLWAAERIRDLESASLQERRKAANRERVLKLALEHGLVCQYTSMVVVEKREGTRRSSGVPETRVVPVHLPAGWAMFEQQGRAGVVAHCLYAASAALPVMAGAMTRHVTRALSDRFSAHDAAPPPSDAPSAAAYDAPASAYGAWPGGLRSPSGGGWRIAREPDDPVWTLLDQQLASGLWDEAGKGNPEDCVGSTARSLLLLLDRGVSASNRLHGGQLRKAIDALVAGAAALADSAPALAAFAIGVAWLSASRKRRRAIQDQATSMHLQGLPFGDEADMRRWVEQQRSEQPRSFSGRATPR